MVQTQAGGKKAVKTIKEKWGADFYRNIGRKGGKNGHTGGFASDVIGIDGLTGRERATIAGRIGGMKSRRGKAKHDNRSY